jgi:hypothetical protein
MKRTGAIAALVVVVFGLAAASIALASSRDHGNGKGNNGQFSAKLSGFNEVPPILTNGIGSFQATISSTTMTYKLTFSGLTTPATQAHLHFGVPGVNGGVFVFLCTNLGNGPAGTPACPAGGGTVTGTATAANILAVAGQNVPAGSFDAAMRIIRSGNAYANVHSTNFQAGEIRGQVKSNEDDD